MWRNVESMHRKEEQLQQVCSTAGCSTIRLYHCQGLYNTQLLFLPSSYTAATVSCPHLVTVTFIVLCTHWLSFITSLFLLSCAVVVRASLVNNRLMFFTPFFLLLSAPFIVGAFAVFLTGAVASLAASSSFSFLITAWWCAKFSNG